MANQTIPNLPAAVSLNGTEQIWAVQNGADVRVTTAQLNTFTTSGLVVSSLSSSDGSLNISSPTGAVVANINFNKSNVWTGQQTFVSPILGTPASVNLANATNLPSTSISGTISNSQLANSTISGVPLGSGLYILSFGTHFSGGAYNGGSPVTISVDATSANTSGTIISRDSSGNFSANISNLNSIVLNGSSSGTTAIKPNATAGSWTLTLPSSAGSVGSVLSTDGAGNTSWVSVSGTGTVTSVSQTFTGGIISVSGSPITTSGTLALTVAGTSGGIPYFSGATSWASSAALAQYGVVYGGGTGGAPAATAAGSTGQVLLANTSSAPTWGQVSLTAGVTGVLPPANGGTGVSTIQAYSLIVGNGTSAVSTVPAVASGSVLVSTGTSSAPAYSSSPTIIGTTTSAAFIANETISGSLNAGAFSYGTLAFSDINIFASYSANSNTYTQLVIQNTNSGATASADIVVNNDLGTSSGYYGNFGINSSGFTGSGSLNLPSATYVYSTGGDLTLGTSTSNAIHFVVNSGATDAVTVSPLGLVTANNFVSSNAAITGGTIDNVTIGGVTPAAGTFNSITDSGSITFTGSTGQRFIANFSNATLANRFSFVTSTTNATTGIYALPNGTSTAASWQAANAADPTNASKILIATNGSTDVQLVSDVNGTGTYLPLSFYTNGLQQMQLGTAGTLGLGTNAVATTGFQNSWNITGGTTVWGQLNNNVIQSDVTNISGACESQVSLAAASFTLGTLAHFYANPNSGGAGSTVSSQMGFYAESTIGTQGAATITKAYGFYGNVASGASRWNLYMKGTAPNYMAGSLGIGTTSVSTSGISIGGNITGVTSYQSVSASGTVQSGVTGYVTAYASYINAAAASFTITEVDHFLAQPTSGGAGSTITTQTGFFATSALGTAGAATVTNAYGFRGQIASGTNRWNLYMDGTANNYMAGALGVGTTSVGSAGSIIATGAITSTGTGGVGYSTGAGGTVTQGTSRTTGVTLNKTTGAITMFTAAGSATPASFTVTNSTVAATDVIILNISSGASNTYVLSVTTVSAGSFKITFYTTGGTTSDTPVINFAVIKGATA